MIRIGIRARLTAGIISAVVVVTMIIVGYFSIHNRKSDKKSSFDLIDNTCDKVSSEIAGRLNIDLGRTRSLAASYESYGTLNPKEVDSILITTDIYLNRKP